MHHDSPRPSTTFSEADAPPPLASTPPYDAAPARVALDRSLAAFRAGRGDLGLRSLVPFLDTLRRGSSPMAWKQFVHELARKHPVRDGVLEDPFTWRAQARPRGYPGDAELLDLIYRAAPLPPDTTTLGRSIYGATSMSAACVSVRERRELLGWLIDSTAERCGGRARVLSLACGHLREAERSRHLADGNLGEFIALDQDPASVQQVAAAHRRVDARVGTVRDVLTGRFAERDFDLIYSAGLYDYLDDRVATALTGALFNLLRPGGKLVLGNFSPSLVDVGYMEAYMDWHLLYRTEAELRHLADPIPASELANVDSFSDAMGNVAYLALVRA